jgi:hypothetical protein
MVPSEFAPWRHEFGIGNVPRPLIVFGEWLAELKDAGSIPVLEHYAKTSLVPVSNTMQRRAPSLIAQIDGGKAIRALRRLGSRGLRDRVRLGDPVAIDAALQQARALYGSRWDDTGESYGLFSLIYSVLMPGEKPTAKAIGDGSSIEALWKKLRQEFVDAFIRKYGFDPDENGDED